MSPRHLILGTAGHIDHGKTTLVRRLTGAAGDRLPAEQARGITIDLGFSRLQLGPHTVGVVDVPGHERFVRNMLAGATGLDLALLVVAADDGVMPQTREHLAILELLGVRHGVVALTKRDLVSAERLTEATAAVRELLAGTSLADAVIVPTAADGTGVPELTDALHIAAARVAAKPTAEPFRLAIDRAFSVAGHGTVVTGTVASGVLAVGDALDWHRGAVETVRVRGLSVHGETVEAVTAGQRAGVNLAGVPLDAVRRGQELAAPGSLVPGRVLTARLHALVGGRAVRHRLPVRLHLGTAEVMAEVSVLDADHIDPGGWAVGQLFTAEPVMAVWGQPFVLRDAAAETTLGGGRVLDPSAARLRRRHVAHIERAEELGSADPAVRAAAAAWLAGAAGLSPTDLGRLAGVWGDESASAVDGLVVLGGGRLWHADRLADLERHTLDTLAGWHAEQPLVTAHDRGRLVAALGKLAAEPVAQAVIDRLLADKRLVGDARRVAATDFKPKLSGNQRKLRDRIVAAHAAAGFSPPEPAGFANHAGGNAASLADIYAVAVAEGLLVKVGPDLYLTADHEAELRRRVTDRLAAGPATMGELRDLLGTTRKYSLPYGEYLDGLGLTVREGDFRRLV